MSMEKELQDAVKEKINELSLAHYEGKIKAVLIVAVDVDNHFRLMQAYSSFETFAINTGLDLAKMGLMQQVVNSTQQRKSE